MSLAGKEDIHEGCHRHHRRLERLRRAGLSRVGSGGSHRYASIRETTGRNASSTRGGTPPYLSPYFAAKAAMDSLAVSYAGELARWGIETSIIVPGAFTKGTNYFAHAGSPADKARAAEYDEGPYAGLHEQSLKGLSSLEPATRPSASGHSAPTSTRRRMAARSSMA